MKKAKNSQKIVVGGAVGVAWPWQLGENGQNFISIT